MFFIVKNKSNTGKQLSQFIFDRYQLQRNIAKLARKYQFVSWKSAENGKIIFVKFDTIPDQAVWKKVRLTRGCPQNQWMPRSRSVVGKQILEQFNQIPRINSKTVSKVLGICGNVTFFTKYKNFIGLEMPYESFKKSSNFPIDCQEVLESRFKILYSKNLPTLISVDDGLIFSVNLK